MISFVFISVIAMLCVASLYGWQNIARRWAHGLPLVDGEPLLETPLGLVDVGIMFVTWFSGQLLAGLILHLAGSSLLESNKGSDLAIMIGVMAICQFGSTGLGLAITYFRHRAFRLLGFPWKNWRSDLRIGLLFFVLVVPPLLILQWSLTKFVDYSHVSMDALRENPTLITMAAVWFGAVISAPICEEVFFRGILQSWLQRVAGRETSLETLIAGGWSRQPGEKNADKLPIIQAATEGSLRSNSVEAKEIDQNNPYAAPGQLYHPPVRNRNRNLTNEQTSNGAGFAIFLSSLVFAAVHIGQGLAPIPLFFMGLALGYLYSKTNSLLPCIVLHLALNAFSMFWFTVSLFVRT